MNFIRFIVLLLNLSAIAFVISAAVLEIGLGLSTAPVCSSAIIICLVAYVANKVTCKNDGLPARLGATPAPSCVRFTNESGVSSW
jgi:hypothetical protein